MHSAYLVFTILFAIIVSYSGVGKIRRDPRQVRVVHETVGVPLKYLALLAAGEFAGAVGLMIGIWSRSIGFRRESVSAAGALALRVLTI